ncbi:MAG: hypothetical protein QNJ44_17465 [Rhodobacter sp.]|nr:hypothetical protein [Rhodobacter sp.]
MKQAQRQKLDPREIKAVFQEAWERSDTLKALGNAPAERGHFLAKGDRRGLVAVDVQGGVYALSKWTGLRAKDVREKLGSPDVDEIVLTPNVDRSALVADMKGDLAAVLSLASGKKSAGHAKNAGSNE